MIKKDLSLRVPSEKALGIFERGRNILENSGGHKLENIDYKKLMVMCEKKPGYLVEVNLQDYLAENEPEQLFIVGCVGERACFGLVEKKDNPKESKLTLQLFNANHSDVKREDGALGLTEGAAALREFTEIMNIDCLAIHLPDTLTKNDSISSTVGKGKAKRAATGIFDMALKSAGLSNTEYVDGNKVYTRYNKN